MKTKEKIVKPRSAKIFRFIYASDNFEKQIEAIAIEIKYRETMIVPVIGSAFFMAKIN